MRIVDLIAELKEIHEQHGNIAVGCWLNDIDGELHSEEDGTETTRDPDLQVRHWDGSGTIMSNNDDLEESVGMIVVL